MKIAIILAGGKSRRMGGDKLSLKIEKKTILEHAIEKFDVDKVILAKGGKTRQETLAKALAKLRGNPLIIIHNGANPFVTRKEIQACIRAAEKYGAAYVGHEIYDTVHDKKTGKTLKRENLIKAQTPQIGYLKDFKKALALGIECTDEVELLSLIGIKARPIPASENNFKVTTWAGYEYAKYLFGETISGIGQDSHPFSKTEKGLTLGGLTLKNEFKAVANSDGDVILHATINAIQSAIGAKSLGSFADNMCKKGVKDSKKYLAHALKNMSKKGLVLKEIRLSVEATQPNVDKLHPRITKKLQKLTGCKNIGLTATTGNRKSNLIKCTSLVTLTSAV